MIYVAEGDSITQGTGNMSYADYTLADTPYAFRYSKAAVNGSVLVPDIVPRAPAVDALATSTINILSVMATSGIITDTAQWLSDYADYLDARRAAGYKVILCTITPRSDPGTFEAARITANSTLRTWVGTHCDALCDFGADPIVGAEGADLDAALYPDGIHPSAAAQMYMRSVFAPVFNGLVASLV